MGWPQKELLWAGDVSRGEPGLSMWLAQTRVGLKGLGRARKPSQQSGNKLPCGTKASDIFSGGVTKHFRNADACSSKVFRSPASWATHVTERGYEGKVSGSVIPRDWDHICISMVLICSRVHIGAQTWTWKYKLQARFRGFIPEFGYKGEAAICEGVTEKLCHERRENSRIGF